MSTRGSKYLTSRLFSCFAQCRGCSSLVVVRSIWKCSELSCLVAAAITSHCISLFYGHKQLGNSPSPFGASLETSASVLFTTSEPGRFPTVGGVCIVNMLWFIHIKSWISRKRMYCVVAVSVCVSLCVCAAFLCLFLIYINIFSWPHYLTPATFFFFSTNMEDVLNFDLVPYQYCGFTDHIYKKVMRKTWRSFHFVWWCYVYFSVLLCEHVL